jgi:hypothetical protein
MQFDSARGAAAVQPAFRFLDHDRGPVHRLHLQPPSLGKVKGHICRSAAEIEGEGARRKVCQSDHPVQQGLGDRTGESVGVVRQEAELVLVHGSAGPVVEDGAAERRADRGQITALAALDPTARRGRLGLGRAVVPVVQSGPVSCVEPFRSPAVHRRLPPLSANPAHGDHVRSEGDIKAVSHPSHRRRRTEA